MKKFTFLMMTFCAACNAHARDLKNAGIFSSLFYLKIQAGIKRCL